MGIKDSLKNIKGDNIVAKGIRFVFNNRQIKESLIALPYAAFYRFTIWAFKPKFIRKFWGEQGVESQPDDTEEHYRYAYRVGVAVNLTCTRTAWESKCLVRALTARKMLKNKGIHSTLYLGCGIKEGKMVAHAWLRCGTMYVTGGNGEEYSIVDKYAN